MTLRGWALMAGWVICGTAQADNVCKDCALLTVSPGTINEFHVSTPWPVPTITVPKYGSFKPRPDITAEESAWLSLMWAVAFGCRDALFGCNYDYAAFIEEHHLQRHFHRTPDPKEGQE